MSVATQHVDMPSEQSSLAVVQECIKKAGAMQAEIQASAAAAEQAAKSQMSAEADMMTEVVAEVAGLGGIKGAVDLVDQRMVDNHAESADANKMVDLGLADADKITSMEAPRSIQTDFTGPSFTEQFATATMSFGGLMETKGMKAEEEATAEMASVHECKAVMQLANEKVMAVGMQLANSAPAPGGLGLTSGASIQDTQAAAYAQRSGQDQNQSQQPYQSFAPSLDLATLSPKGPSADMLSDVKDDEAMV